jgi:DNA-binding NtrC family response regulator
MTSKISISILVLDDNLDDLHLIKRELDKTGTFDVQTFHDPEEFKAALNEETYMVITDVKMDNYNVFDTVCEIKSTYPGIYVIVISGYFDVAIIKRLVNECHIWGVIEKIGLNWLSEIKEIVHLTVPKMLQKKMAQYDD